MTKRLIALALAFVLGFGIAVPKAHADEPPSAIMFSSGVALIGGGAAALIFFDDDEPLLKYGLGLPFLGLGIGSVIWGFFMLSDELAMVETDPVLKHVRLDVTSTGLVLGGHFSWKFLRILYQDYVQELKLTKENIPCDERRSFYFYSQCFSCQ
jgi:hypothetical protein